MEKKFGLLRARAGRIGFPVLEKWGRSATKPVVTSQKTSDLFVPVCCIALLRKLCYSMDNLGLEKEENI